MRFATTENVSGSPSRSRLIQVTAAFLSRNDSRPETYPERLAERLCMACLDERKAVIGAVRKHDSPASEEHWIMNIRESLGSDHKAIERKLTDLANAVEGADFPTILAVFRRVERGLRAHTDGEERYLFPHFEEQHADAIAQLRKEHELFRRLLDELMVQTELHTLRKESIDDLVAQLRAHAAKENRTLYAWADDSPPKEPRDGLTAFLTEIRRALRDEE